MNLTKITSIKKELIVETSQEIAFEVFTEKMDLWWPRTHHIGKSPMVELILEPVLNGRWYSRHEDGSEANVGHILKWEPHSRIVLAWQVNGDFKFDPELITEVEICFIPEGPESTKIKFEHRDLDRLGGGKAVESMDEGWGMILELYKGKIG
jgi:uncharacterized protein YndB with AHSA1/START domain